MQPTSMGSYERGPWLEPQQAGLIKSESVTMTVERGGPCVLLFGYLYTEYSVEHKAPRRRQGRGWQELAIPGGKLVYEYSSQATKVKHEFHQVGREGIRWKRGRNEARVKFFHIWASIAAPYYYIF